MHPSSFLTLRIRPVLLQDSISFSTLPWKRPNDCDSWFLRSNEIVLTCKALLKAVKTLKGENSKTETQSRCNYRRKVTWFTCNINDGQCALKVNCTCMFPTWKLSGDSNLAVYRSHCDNANAKGKENNKQWERFVDNIHCQMYMNRRLVWRSSWYSFILINLTSWRTKLFLNPFLPSRRRVAAVW